MNKRQLEILGRITEDPKFYTIPKLSNITGKSVRTIYNDLNEINRYFAKNKMKLVEISEDGEVKYHDNNQTILNNITIYDYELNSEERIYMIICLLLMVDEYITLQSISELLFCSRSTILKDIKVVKERLFSDNVTLVSNQNRGFKIKGDEINFRNLFISISEKEPFLIQLLFTIRDILCIEDEVIKEIEKTLFYTLLKNKLSLIDQSHRVLLTYLIYIKRRIENKHILNDLNDEAEKYMDWSKEIINRLFKDIDLKGEEIFLSKILGNMRFTKKDTKDHSFVTIHILVTLFIEEISKELNIDLTQDKELFSNLSNHMFDILNNSYSQNIESKELQYVMEKNDEVVTTIKNNVYVFENYISRNLSKIEIGYLSLHILASMEKDKIIKNELRVLLICNSGIGTSRLLKTRLDNHYLFNVVDILSVYELELYDISHIDLVISTVQLNRNLEIPYVQVGVHLNEQDLKSIDKSISKIKKDKDSFKKQDKKIESELVLKIKPYFENHKTLFRQIETLIQNYFKDDKEEEQKNLSDFINEDMISLDVIAKDWKDAICKSVIPLEKKGLVTNQFKEEIVQSVENYGDYIMISDDIVFPHAGFDQGAKLTGFTFTRYSSETYISDSKKKIKMAFALSASDNKKHVKALFTLVELANNEDYKTRLMNANTKREIIEIIKGFEENEKVGY